jgi:hypothetical protein
MPENRGLARQDARRRHRKPFVARCMIKKARSNVSGLLVLYGLGVVVGSAGGAVGAGG